jgi:hypothetical protein
MSTTHWTESIQRLNEAAERALAEGKLKTEHRRRIATTSGIGDVGGIVSQTRIGKTNCLRCSKPFEQEIIPFCPPNAYCSDECLFADHPEKRHVPDGKEATPTLSNEQRRQAAWERMCPARYLAFEWEKLKPQAQKVARQLKAEGYQAAPKGAVLHGASESGKSFLAYRLAWHLHMAGHEVRMVDVPTLWETIAYHADERDDAEARCKTSAVLLLDDLGMESASSGWVSALYRIIDRRERDGLPTILTTNKDAEYFRSAYGVPLANRLERCGSWFNVESTLAHV